jgi:hypothetical protein
VVVLKILCLKVEEQFSQDQELFIQIEQKNLQENLLSLKQRISNSS